MLVIFHCVLTFANGIFNYSHPTFSPHTTLLKSDFSAWGWCTGMTQRDGMGREVGGGFRMGNTCTPVVDAYWYMAKQIQYCKVKNNNNKKNKSDFTDVPFLIPRRACKNMHVCVQNRLTLGLMSIQESTFLWFSFDSWRNCFVYVR